MRTSHVVSWAIWCGLLTRQSAASHRVRCCNDLSSCCAVFLCIFACFRDYMDQGAESPGRPFQTLNAIDSSTGNSTSEEFHYTYDTAGRPFQATFAMTPQSWTPSNGAPFYDSSHKAATRARTIYSFDGDESRCEEGSFG
jgi:hypothetical protein